MNVSFPETTAAPAAPITPVAVQPAQEVQRTIIHRTKGRKHGPITRLVSPGDVGGLIKPFIFLDYFDFPAGPAAGFGWHPHSGLATLTVLLSGSSSYADSSGKSGELHAGSLEWMRAGGGVWHTSSPIGDAPLRGFQLWVALPPDLEHSEAFSQYIEPEKVEHDGEVTVVLGTHGTAGSAIDAPSSMHYFNIDLVAGQRWEYVPPAGHTVAWVFAHKGRLHVAGEEIQNELAVFNASEGSLFLRPKATRRSCSARRRRIRTNCIWVITRCTPMRTRLRLAKLKSGDWGASEEMPARCRNNKGSMATLCRRLSNAAGARCGSPTRSALAARLGTS
jgi:redox-sensitive bicupin YhaK (pirin superfamily)